MTNASTVAVLAVAAVDDMRALLHDMAPTTEMPPVRRSRRNA